MVIQEETHKAKQNRILGKQINTVASSLRIDQQGGSKFSSIFFFHLHTILRLLSSHSTNLGRSIVGIMKVIGEYHSSDKLTNFGGIDENPAVSGIQFLFN